MTKITFDLDSELYSLLKTIAKEDDSSIARVVRREMKAFIIKNKPEKEIRYNEDGTEMD